MDTQTENLLIYEISQNIKIKENLEMISQLQETYSKNKELNEKDLLAKNILKDSFINLLIQKIHYHLMDVFDIEVIRILRKIVVNQKSKECFFKFIEMYLHFKDNDTFANEVIECKDTYFIYFFKYAKELKAIEVFKDLIEILRSHALDKVNHDI